MTPHEFIAKWRNGGDERRDFQSFFDDLCRLVGHKTPREADPGHTWFTYEYGATKTTGGEGWADAWKKGFFGFEAKGTGKDLAKAYAQLKMYADALENPPLLIVSDLQRFEIHTNFTATVKQVYRFTVDDLADHETRRVLVAAFNDPQQLRPGITRADITKAAAGKFATLADALATTRTWWRISSIGCCSACSPRISACYRITFFPSLCAVSRTSPTSLRAARALCSRR